MREEQERRMGDGWVGIKIYKLYYVPGIMLDAVNSIISFRTNLRGNICDKYFIEKICSVGSSRHLKLL